jgi:hypothetical protein
MRAGQAKVKMLDGEVPKGQGIGRRTPLVEKFKFPKFCRQYGKE